MPDVLLAVTLFGDGGSPQLCGPAMVKTAPSHEISRVLGCFCRWADVDPATVTFHTVNGRSISPETSVADSGLASSHAVTAIPAADSPPPADAACKAQFAFLNVEDSELAALTGNLMRSAAGASDGGARSRSPSPDRAGERDRDPGGRSEPSTNQ